MELIAKYPLRSEWYSRLDEIALAKAEERRALIARADGSIACFRFFSWNHEAIVAELVGCGLPVEHVDKVTYRSVATPATTPLCVVT